MGHTSSSSDAAADDVREEKKHEEEEESSIDKTLCFNALFCEGGCRFCNEGTCRYTNDLQRGHLSESVSATFVALGAQQQRHCRLFFETGECSERSASQCTLVHDLTLEMLSTRVKQTYGKWKPPRSATMVATDGNTGARGRGADRGHHGGRGGRHDNSSERGRGRGRGIVGSAGGRGHATSPHQGRGRGDKSASPAPGDSSKKQASKPSHDGSRRQSGSQSSGSPDPTSRNVPPLPPSRARSSVSPDRRGASASGLAQTSLCWFHVFAAAGCRRGDKCWFNHIVQEEHVCGLDLSELIAYNQSHSTHKPHCKAYFTDGECSTMESCPKHHVLMFTKLNRTQQIHFETHGERGGNRRGGSVGSGSDSSVSSFRSTSSANGSSASSRHNRPSSASPQRRGENQSNMRLKSQAERDADRACSNFPILQCKDEFVRRLADEKVLVVTAATGSGKTTQLPQYAAEVPQFSHGLVVCTQPRAIAALSISQRIADEYDGNKKGPNVGYRIGGGKEQRGRRIMLMTDAALVRMAQTDRTLNTISVLIIDEAHERSLNTDLVVAISKLVLQNRQDFHVVIASATIDPAPFLQYYFGMAEYQSHPALNVPGNLHPITIEEVPISADDVGRNAFTSQLLKVVKKTLVKYPEGHCLVFLSGSGEIESAIKAFNRDKQDDWIPKPLYGGLPPEVQSAVLNFEDKDGQLRMVCFCTNVAETSLTVPNVRIVIDSGLAKEARFDAMRRMNVVEEVYISVASADQRKGRAGRTTPGHCVRLYTKDELPRQNIEPEILRSSLDMVVLQLVKLGYDPLTFPFMDRPASVMLEQSIALLTELRCFEVKGSQDRIALTSRGQLFNDLPFDPRMSNFVVSACEADIRFLEPAAEIAAILTAPGSIFFMGGADKAEKLAKQSRISTSAARYDSDLLFLRSVYRDWFDSGKVNARTGRCDGCDAKVSARFGCKKCRKTIANDMDMNNKIMSIVEGTVSQVTSTIRRVLRPNQDSSAGADELPSDERLAAVIGESLAQCFFDQICQLILPSKPEAGVYLLEADEKGSLANTSAIAQRIGSSNTRASSLFIAMSIKQIPSGEFKVEQLHRVSLDWVPASRRDGIDKTAFDVVQCCVKYGIAFDYKRKLELHFLRWSERYRAQLLSGNFTPRGPMPRLDQIKKIEPERFADFVVCVYDQTEHALVVYGPKRFADTIASIADSFLDGEERELLHYQHTEVIGRGTAIATLTAGLQMERIEAVGLACRLTLENLPKHVCDKKSLQDFVLMEMQKIERDKTRKHKIQWSRFYSAEDQLQFASRSKGEANLSPRGLVVFATDSSAQIAQKALRNYVVIDDGQGGSGKNSQRIATNESWGRVVLWKVARNEGVERMRSSLAKLVGLVRVEETRLSSSTVSFVQFKKAAFKLKIQNLPADTTEASLRRFLPRHTHCDVFIPKTPRNNVLAATLEFRSTADRDVAQVHLSTSPLMTQSVTVQTDRRSFTKNPVVAIGPDVEGCATYELLFDSSGAAESFIQTHSYDGEVRGYAQLEVKQASLFDLEAMCAALSKRFDAECHRFTWSTRDAAKSTSIPKRDGAPDSIKVVFIGASARACGQACQSLMVSVAPLRVVVTNHEQRLMLGELDENGHLTQWAKELNLHLQYNRSRAVSGRTQRLYGISIFGDGVNQGRFMRRIADYADEFSKRFTLLRLGESAGLFRPGHTGSSTLTKLTKKVKSKCDIEYDKYQESIQILVKPSVSTADAEKLLAECSAEIDGVLVAAAKGKVVKAWKDDTCIFCKMKGEMNLSICGHGACKACLIDVILSHVEASENTGEPFLPVTCRDCGKRISVVDLKKLENKTVLNRAYYASARTFLMSQTKSSLSICPSADCGAFVARVNGYSHCSGCGSGVCLSCDTINDDLHAGRSCADYNRERALLRTFDLTDLFRRAEDWATQNWDCTIAPQFTVSENESLRFGCPAFDRYVEGIIQLGGLKAVANRRFFAWHGTAEPAIGPICQNGFDPSRRSGQVHGAGEYFGQSASVSLGYVRGSSRLIVAEIIQSPNLVKVVTNFCYVVSNPTDWSLSYNLPVIVLSFKSMYGTKPQYEQPQVGQSLSAVLSKFDRSGKPPPSTSLTQVSSGQKAVTDGLAQNWTSPFRWLWRKDDMKFEPYADSITALLEEAYTRGERVYRTPPIVRYLDDKPQEYIIHFRDQRTGADLTNMMQEHSVTRYQRDIRRERNAVPQLKDVRWAYSEYGRWTKYESSVQRVIEDAFTAYVNQSTAANSKYIVRFPGRPEQYELDFVQGTQRNVESSTQRQIRRFNHVKQEYREETVIDVALSPEVCSTQWLDRLTKVLEDMVLAALSSTTNLRGGIVSTTISREREYHVKVSARNSQSGRQLVIETSGGATTICSLLVARVRTILLDEKKLHIPLRNIHAHGVSGKHMMQNSRLLQLVTKSTPPSWKTREDVMLQLAHAIIWQGECPIYGGFVRDWVLRGESANDIDVHIEPPNTTVAMLAGIIHRTLSQQADLNFVVTDRGQKGAAHCLRITGPSLKKYIEIDLVDKTNISFTPPGVDSDVGNLLVDKTGLHKKFKDADASQIPIDKVIQHAQKKKFVFFYDLSRGDQSVAKRLQKYLDRGWTCLSVLPSEQLNQLSDEHKVLVRPKQKYNMRWWAEY